MKKTQLSDVKERLTSYIDTMDNTHYAYEFVLKLKRYGNTKIDEVIISDIGTISNENKTTFEE